MRATDGLQTTITLGAGNHHGQAFSLALSLEMSLPMPQRLPATATGGVMDRQHTGGEIQRLGGVGTLQKPGDELVATRGAGLGRAGSRAAQR